jgi:hypothetical protein
MVPSLGGDRAYFFLSLFVFVFAAIMGFADLFYYLLQLNEDKSPFQRIFVNQVFQLTVFFVSRFHFCVDDLTLPAPIFLFYCRNSLT